MAHAGKTLSQQAVAALDEARRKAQNPPHANRGGSSGQTTDFQTENQAPGNQKPAVCASKCPHLRTSGRRARKPHQPWKNGWKHRGFLIGSPSRCRTDATGRANAAGLTRPRLPRRPACRASNASKLCNASTMRTRWARKRPARHGMPFASGPCWPGCTCRGSGTERTASRRPCITRTRRWQKSGGPR